MSRRMERIAEQLKSEIARVLREEATDPRIRMVTLTRVDCAPDLSSALVFWSSIEADGEEALSQIEAGLASAASFVRRRIAQVLPLRRTPAPGVSLRPLAGTGRSDPVFASGDLRWREGVGRAAGREPAPSGFLVGEQAAGLDVPRRRRRRAAVARNAPGGTPGNARPARHRRVAPGGPVGHQARPLHRGRGQGLRGDDPPGRRHGHARRRGDRPAPARRAASRTRPRCAPPSPSSSGRPCRCRRCSAP